MRIILRRFIFITISLLAVILLQSCSGTNEDTVSEISCSTAEGIWSVLAVTCDGVAQTGLTPSSFLFDQDAKTVVETRGRVDCTAAYTWNVEIGSDTPLFSMAGSGTLSCMASGEAAEFCRSQSNENHICTTNANISGIKNEFPTCVITNAGMHLMRTVTAVNSPDNQSYCQFGEAEEVVLTRGEYIPPEPTPETNPNVAIIDVEGPNPLDFGTHSVGDRITKVLTLTNIGRGTATALSMTGLIPPFSFLNGSYPGERGTCGNELQEGRSCTLVIEFFPKSNIDYSGSLSISYGNGQATVTVRQGLAGAGTADLARVVISDGGFYDFGVIEIGQTASKTFTLTNAGAGLATALTAEELEVPFSIVDGLVPDELGNCGVELAAGATCQFDVEFSPNAVDDFDETITVNYLDGINNQSVHRSISGSGVNP